MKKILSFALVILVLLSLLPAGYAFSEEDYERELKEIEETVSGWKGVKQLYTLDTFDCCTLFAVTEKGKVLTTNEDYKACTKWSDVVSLCIFDSGDGCYIFGLRGNGTVCGICYEGDKQLLNEVTKWKNVQQLYEVGYFGDSHGVCALCYDGSVIYTDNLAEEFKFLPEVAVMSICIPNYSYSTPIWAAITEEGNAIAGYYHRDEEENWVPYAELLPYRDVEDVQIVDYYNGWYFILRTADGSTIDAYPSVDDGEYGFSKTTAEIVKIKNLCAVEYDPEDDWFVYLTDDGNADVIYMGNWYESDSSSRMMKPYLSSIKNARAMLRVVYLECEDGDGFLSSEDYDYYYPLILCLLKDGTIADCVQGEKTVHFQPEEVGAKIISLVSYDQGSLLFGLTEEGNVTRIHVLSGPSASDSSDSNSQDRKGSPSAADLDAIGTKITYPKAESYLDEYLYSVITPGEGKTGVYAYTKSKGGEKLRTIDADTEVTVIAEENGRYCVIVESTGKAYWINTKYNP